MLGPQKERNEFRHASPRLSTVEARQAETTGRMRYILGISLTLAALALIALWLAKFM